MRRSKLLWRCRVELLVFGVGLTLGRVPKYLHERSGTPNSLCQQGYHNSGINASRNQAYVQEGMKDVLCYGKSGQLVALSYPHPTRKQLPASLRKIFGFSIPLNPDTHQHYAA